MKLAKRTLALVLAVMMLVAVMVVPASAASGYESRFREFRQISVADVGAHPGYTKALQKFLCVYSSYYKTLIEGAGGIDGIFGPKTGDVVGYYQTAKGIKKDGICGPNTWEKIASDLIPDESDQASYRVYLKRGEERVYYVFTYGTYIYSIYIDGEGAIQFHPET